MTTLRSEALQIKVCRQSLYGLSGRRKVKAAYPAIALIGLAISLPLAASPADDIAEHWRIDASANAFRDGETIELGVITPTLFKFRKESRHYWSLFGTVGLHTLSNQQLQGKVRVEEQLTNIEAIGGLFAHGGFYGDFLYQYGKVAADFVSLDGDIRSGDRSMLGALLESGIEFRSSFARLSWSDIENPVAIHVGLRWRFGFDSVDGLQGSPNPLDGISFVIGSRFMF